MTVKELISFLRTFDQDLEVITTRYSDYELIDKEHWSIVKAIQENSGYMMRTHHSIPEELKRKEKEYLHLRGN